jgi:hypothetical protein
MSLNPSKKNPHQIDFLSPVLIVQIATAITKLPQTDNADQDKSKPKSMQSTLKKPEPIMDAPDEDSPDDDEGTPLEEDESENKKTPKGKKRSRKD